MVSINKNTVLLFLVGFCLSIAQFVMIRDFVTVLYGEEVVIVLVTVAFFTGLSVGYLLSLKVGLSTFRLLFIGSVFLHLTFPFSYRLLASWFAMMEVNGLGYLALLFFYAVIFSSIFAAFLPRLVEANSTGHGEGSSLKPFYTVELLGFMAGFIAIYLSFNHPITHLLPFYWILLGIVLYLVTEGKKTTITYFVVASVAMVFLPRADVYSSSLLYETKHGIDGAKVLYSVNSPYQKVEVVEDDTGDRMLYLDGLLNLNASDLDALNYYVAVVPARLLKPEKAVIIGNGTLTSVPKVSPYVKNLKTVELDPGVLRAGKEFYSNNTELEKLDNWSFEINDGKNFLLSNEETVGLIVMDIPSPLTIQEAYLHSVEFYRLAQSRLGKSGVIAVQLSGPLQKNDRTPARVVAALQGAFKEVLVVYSPDADRGFAYAANELPFSAADVKNASLEFEQELEVIAPSEVPEYLKKAVPLSVDSMDIVLRRGWERFTDRYFE